MSHTNKVKDTIIALKKKYADSPWKTVISKLLDTEEFSTALFQLMSDVEAKQMFTPILKNIFRNLELCKPNGVNVVFITAYPFENKGVADGLAFSSSLLDFPEGKDKSIIRFQQALVENRTDNSFSDDCSLAYLVEQGVLLWNISLTCPIGKRSDHYPMWEPISRMFFTMLSKHIKNVVYIFVGEKATLMATVIQEGNTKLFLPSIEEGKEWNYIDSFKGINKILEQQKKHPINW